jgi:hypothetical protein
MRTLIGFDRKIKRVWLDHVLEHLRRSSRLDELRAFLDERLRDELLGKGSRVKIVGIILRIWCKIPARLVPLRADALAILSDLTFQERLWLHWAMTALAYPFFREVVHVSGRLFAVQDEVNAAQVQARIPAPWGLGTRTGEAVTKVLHTLVDWKVLQSGKVAGNFVATGKLSTDSTPLQVWLLEALLRAGPSEELDAKQLWRLPEAFPFSLGVRLSDLRKTERFNIRRRGQETKVVSVSFQRRQGPFKPARKERGGAARKPHSLAPDCAGSSPGMQAEGEGIAALGAAGPPTPAAFEHHATAVHAEPDAPVVQSLDSQGQFAAARAECVGLFRAGQFYGSIALAHSLIEAIVRHAWQAKLNLDRTKAGSFSDNVRSLCSIGVVSTELKTRLDRLWIERNEYQQLAAGPEGTATRLAEIADEGLRMLTELERAFFGCSQRSVPEVNSIAESGNVEPPGESRAS